jgi:hypothetical protein
MRYLHQCAKAYIEETHGEKLWSSLKGNIMYILTHPNGWGGPEQAQMRQAAIQAGFIPNTEEGRSRVAFVTEGEASLHFCLSNGLSITGNDACQSSQSNVPCHHLRSSQENSGVLIVDAGGGTIDITSYRKLKDHTFEEIAIPACEHPFDPPILKMPHSFDRPRPQATSKALCMSPCGPKRISKVLYN